jgi:hypothetical protein
MSSSARTLVRSQAQIRALGNWGPFDGCEDAPLIHGDLSYFSTSLGFCVDWEGALGTFARGPRWLRGTHQCRKPALEPGGGQSVFGG